MATFYVSTPIYYVNDLPHIGHVYTTVVADVVARYRRLLGDEVFFLTGTDEHGQNIVRAAERLGIDPRTQADRVVTRYHQLWDTLGMSHDDFIRTTEERHRRAVEAIIARMQAAGDFYVDRHEGWYCSSCESFYTEKELLEDRVCPVHERPTEWQSEENVFFRLSRYQDQLLELYDDGSGFVTPASRLNEVRSFVAGGLRDISVSRAGISWGIPFPERRGEVVYVWLDALTNYLSALGFGSDDPAGYERFWTPPEATRVHIVGKDILRFHAVWWPAFLMSAGLPLPSRVVGHGWWLKDERKVSKSVGNVIQPDHLISHFGADSLRYFLLRDMVFGQDAGFSDEAFVDRFNSDLANDLGNTVSRLVKMSRRAFAGRTPPESCDGNSLIEAAGRAVSAYSEAMNEWAFHRALAALSGLLAEVNQYLVAREPWKLVKEEGTTSRVARILWNGLEGVRVVATALLPVMPRTAPRVLAAIGVSEPPASLEDLAWGRLPTGAELPPAEPIFPRIDKAAYLGAGSPVAAAVAEEEEEETDMITIEQFFQTHLRVGTVTAAERVAGTDKLVKLEVDLGEGSPRPLVAGIAQEYEAADLLGKQLVVVANLQPAKLRGVESRGMILAASVDGRPVLIHPDQTVPAGTPVK